MSNRICRPLNNGRKLMTDFKTGNCYPAYHMGWNSSAYAYTGGSPFRRDFKKDCAWLLGRWEALQDFGLISLPPTRATLHNHFGEKAFVTIFEKGNENEN